MNAPKPLFCPFCGSNDVDNGRADARYHCYRCGADGPQIPYAPDDKVWTWNTRATTPDPRDEVIATLVEALSTIRALAYHNTHGEPDVSVEDIHECATAALAAAEAVLK